MLLLPTTNTVYRVAAIDPGTDTLGFAVLDVDLANGEVYLVAARTYSGNSLSGYYETMGLVHGNRAAKIYAHEQSLIQQFHYYRPNSVICESPFLGRFAQAFEALVECKAGIRRALDTYDLTIPLETVDPPTAKMAVGVSGKSRDKNDVRAAVLNLAIHSLLPFPVGQLDQHSMDAVAVGYYKVQQLLRFIGGLRC